MKRASYAETVLSRIAAVIIAGGVVLGLLWGTFGWVDKQDRDVVVMEEVLKFNRQQARINQEELAEDQAAKRVLEMLREGKLKAVDE